MEQCKGANKLAGVIQQRAKTIVAKPSPIDVGVIQPDMGLLCNKFPLPIPQSDYMVCRSVMWGAVGDILFHTQDVGSVHSGYHTHNLIAGGHDHRISVSCGGCSSPSTTVGAVGEHGHLEDGRTMEHKHDVLIGDKMRWLQPNDTVLVVWLDGVDPCVVDIIYPATMIGRDANGYEIVKN